MRSLMRSSASASSIASTTISSMALAFLGARARQGVCATPGAAHASASAARLRRDAPEHRTTTLANVSLAHTILPFTVCMRMHIIIIVVLVLSSGE